MSTDIPNKRGSSGRRARTRDARADQAAKGTNYTRAVDPVDELAAGTVRIRLEAVDPADLAAHEAALRSVLALDSPGRDYGNRRGVGSRRYLRSTGIRDGAAAPAAQEPPYSPRAAADDAKRGRDLLGEIDVLRAADDDLTRRHWFPIQAGDVVLTFLPAAATPEYGVTYVACPGEVDIAGNAMLCEVSRTRQPWDDAEPKPKVPDYELRYDTEAGCWTLLTNDYDPHQDREYLRQWHAAPQLTDPAAVDAAQQWATPLVNDVEQPSADHEVIGWRQAGEGYQPEFDDDAAQAAYAQSAADALTPFYDLWFEVGPRDLVVIRAGAVVHGDPARTRKPAAAIAPRPIAPGARTASAW